MPAAPQTQVIEQINPLSHMSQEAYTKYWQHLFDTVLYGIWGKFFFFALIAMAFWVGVRQRNPTLAAIFILLSAVIAYGAGVGHIITSLARH